MQLRWERPAICVIAVAIVARPRGSYYATMEIGKWDRDRNLEPDGYTICKWLAITCLMNQIFNRKTLRDNQRSIGNWLFGVPGRY